MGIPKRKNMINVYGDKETYQGENIGKRRQELLDRITKSDSFLPDSILHKKTRRTIRNKSNNTKNYTW